MSSCDDREWLEARLAATEELIIAYEEAILRVAGSDGTNGAISYSLDTTQTRVTVTRASLGESRLMLQSLENKRAVLRVKLGYAGGGNLAPNF